MAFRDANEDFFMATDTGALSCRPSLTAGVSAVEAGAAEVSRGIVSTLTWYVNVKVQDMLDAMGSGHP
jgi:hypothetical protein